MRPQPTGPAPPSSVFARLSSAFTAGVSAVASYVAPGTGPVTATGPVAPTITHSRSLSTSTVSSSPRVIHVSSHRKASIVTPGTSRTSSPAGVDVNRRGSLNGDFDTASVTSTRSDYSALLDSLLPPSAVGVAEKMSERHMLTNKEEVLDLKDDEAFPSLAAAGARGRRPSAASTGRRQSTASTGSAGARRRNRRKKSLATREHSSPTSQRISSPKSQHCTSPASQNTRSPAPLAPIGSPSSHTSAPPQRSHGRSTDVFDPIFSPPPPSHAEPQLPFGASLFGQLPTAAVDSDSRPSAIAGMFLFVCVFLSRDFFLVYIASVWSQPTHTRSRPTLSIQYSPSRHRLTLGTAAAVWYLTVWSAALCGSRS